MNNRINSTLLESLLEITRHDAPVELKEQAQRLYEDLSKVPTFVKEVDRTVSAKGYRDTDVVFGRQYRRMCASLSADAQRIFAVMTQICPQSGLVQIPSKLICEDLKIGNKTFLTAMDDLVKADYIKKFAEPVRKSGVPATYMINPEIFSCCKPSHLQRAILDYAHLKSAATPKTFQTAEYDIIKSKQDDRVITVARYKGFSDKEKELDSAKSNSDKDVSRLNSSSSSSSIAQIDILFQEISGEVGVS